MIKYYLTDKEQKELRAACEYMNLRFEAQAARPKIARKLIFVHKKVIKEWGKL
jgi:hypothetical protein